MQIVIAGAGAVGASVAYHLALRGAPDVVLCDVGEIAGGQTAKALGGVRQQFSTEAEVRLAKESIRLFEELGLPFFRQVGYLFVATTDGGLRDLERRLELQLAIGVDARLVDAERIGALAPGVETDDVLGGVFGPRDGLAEPPAVTRELVRRAAARGVEVRERVDVRGLDADVRVIACGPASADVAAAYGVALPIRPLVRQLIETDPLVGLARDLPLVIESETGFHFRRRDESLVLAMSDDEPRWGDDPTVDASVIPDRLSRLVRRYPAAAGVRVRRAWAGLYDMTPDAHPIVGEVAPGLYAACGFSGHGFMQSPAVGRALADEILDGGSALDLSPYRLDRFAAGTTVPEDVVL